MLQGDESGGGQREKAVTASAPGHAGPAAITQQLSFPKDREERKASVLYVDLKVHSAGKHTTVRSEEERACFTYDAIVISNSNQC